RLRLGEAGQVPQVRILPVRIVRVAAAHALGGGGHDDDRVLARHAHQLPPPARELGGGDARHCPHQFRLRRWRGPRTQSPCSSITATRTYSSISVKASSSSSSPSSSARAAASLAR